MNVIRNLANDSSESITNLYSKKVSFVFNGDTVERRAASHVELHRGLSFAGRKAMDKVDQLESPALRTTRQALVIEYFLRDMLFSAHSIKSCWNIQPTALDAPPPYEKIYIEDIDQNRKLAIACLSDNRSVHAQRYRSWYLMDTADKNRLGAQLVLLGAETPMWGWSKVFDQNAAAKRAADNMPSVSHCGVPDHVLREELLTNDVQRFERS